MRIPRLFGQGKPVFSFEFFLPKDPAQQEDFKATVRQLKSLEPSYVTITYGAGGSARSQTIEMAGALKNELGIETASHLTCIAHTKSEIAEILKRIKALGIENIVALRGDQPKDGTGIPIEKRDYKFARDLVADIRRLDGFSIAVAGYPDVHPEAPSLDVDLGHLKEKVDAGGDLVITQLFFDNKSYFDFVARCRAAGITQPIVPGIMPVTNYQQLKRFTQICGAKVTPEMHAALDPIQEDKDAVIRWGIEHALKQCRELLEKGAPGVHFYTLNKSHSTENILRQLRKAS